MSGLVSIAAGLVIKFSGPKAVEKVLPATITGPIAMIIGLTFAVTQLGRLYAFCYLHRSSGLIWLVSLATLLSTIFFSRYPKGFLGQLPLLLGAAVVVP